MTSVNNPEKKANQLIAESSPYLLQHAYNPVDWMPWGPEALQKAEASDKLILVSIGYSACHWCHVMEKECFEDPEVAQIMNQHFINIKVDREERPDIDHIYMDAVQLMTGRGGWPLNCFLLPDGRPIYGGTYFPKKQWMNILESLGELWKNEKAKAYEYAENLHAGLARMDTPQNKAEATDTQSCLKKMVEKWKTGMDSTFGGPDKAPKFPMPNNYEFLLHYAHLSSDAMLMNHIHLTLEQMAWGGIYDQIGGGFARYSTDQSWKVPHFEKMLYDNAQLISLYAKAYAVQPCDLYKNVVYGIAGFCQRELYNGEGAYFSALDADSEGEEGRYYVWNPEEVKLLLGEDYQIAKQYYNLNAEGHWEEDKYILLRNQSDEECARQLGIETEILQTKIQGINQILLAARGQRIAPGLDDKTLTSWNAMLAKGFADASRVFNDNTLLEAAKSILRFVDEKLTDEKGQLYRNYKAGKRSIPAFLEDYAHLIDANIAVYQACFEEKYLTKAMSMTDEVMKKFYDPERKYFSFTANGGEQLIVKKFELMDNVIPASNSVMAKNLFLLSQYFGDLKMEQTALGMLNPLLTDMEKYGPAYSNWGILALWQSIPFHTLVITGKDSLEKIREYRQGYFPQGVAAVAIEKSNLPIFDQRWAENESPVYLCIDKTCDLPSAAVDLEKLGPKF